MGVYSARLRERKDRDFVLGNLGNYTDVMSDFLDK